MIWCLKGWCRNNEEEDGLRELERPFVLDAKPSEVLIFSFSLSCVVAEDEDAVGTADDREGAAPSLMSSVEASALLLP